MSAVDISVLVTLHNEGMLAKASLGSAAHAKARAEAAGLRVEIIAVLDTADDTTTGFARQHADRVISVAYADPGLTRNAGVSVAQGEWIALLDGDDLFGEGWLAKAHAYAHGDGRPLVLHPQATLYFGAAEYVFVHVDMEDPDFDLAAIATSNYWTNLSFARRGTFSSVPFRQRDLTRRIGFEDWGWQMETIAQGFIHKCVPGTAHAVRRKPVSVVQEDTARQALPTPTTLFRSVLEQRARDIG